MIATELVNGQPDDHEVEPSPLVEVAIELAPALQVRMDRCIGDVPLMEVITGRARLLVSVDVSSVSQLETEHVAVAEAFAQAACALRDEVRGLVTARETGSATRKPGHG